MQMTTDEWVLVFVALNTVLQYVWYWRTFKKKGNDGKH
jgi:hypothetical protein